jgi:hypothetical protein
MLKWLKHDSTIHYNCLKFHVTTRVTNKYTFVLKALTGTTLPCNLTVSLSFIYLSINLFAGSPFAVFPNRGQTTPNGGHGAVHARRSASSVRQASSPQHSDNHNASQQAFFSYSNQREGRC